VIDTKQKLKNGKVLERFKGVYVIPFETEESDDWFGEFYRRYGDTTINELIGMSTDRSEKLRYASQED